MTGTAYNDDGGERMAREITVRLIWRGEAVETLPEEARDYLRGCLTADMSAYYAAHPESRAALEGAPYFEADARNAGVAG